MWNPGTVVKHQSPCIHQQINSLTFCPVIIHILTFSAKETLDQSTKDRRGGGKQFADMAFRNPTSSSRKTKKKPLKKLAVSPAVHARADSAEVYTCLINDSIFPGHKRRRCPQCHGQPLPKLMGHTWEHPLQRKGQDFLPSHTIKRNKSDALAQI